MTEVLNTPFELSIRILLILEANNGQPITADMLTAADFITVHGKEFGVHDNNLHGDNFFKFSEFTFKRDMVKAAIKTLVLNGLILLRHTSTGFAYVLSICGTEYCSKINCGYAKEYRKYISKTLYYLNNKTEQSVLKHINNLSIKSLLKSKCE